MPITTYPRARALGCSKGSLPRCQTMACPRSSAHPPIMWHALVAIKESGPGQAIAHRCDRRLVRMKVRPNVGASLAASLAGEQGLDIGQPDFVGPSVSADRESNGCTGNSDSRRAGRARRSRRISPNVIVSGRVRAACGMIRSIVRGWKPLGLGAGQRMRATVFIRETFPIDGRTKWLATASVNGDRGAM